MIRFCSKNSANGKDKAVSFEVFHHASQVNAIAWNAIAGNKIFLQHSYLTALEASKPAGMQFRYVLVHENKTAAAVCYFQLADLSSTELGSIINFEDYGDFLAAVGNKINNMLFSTAKYSSNNLLVCGNLFVSGEYGIACDENFLSIVFKILPEVTEVFLEEIENTGGRIVAVTIKDFYEPEDQVVSETIGKKFHRMVIDPNMIFKVNSNWHSFDDYLDAMSAKYRLRANNVLKKLDDTEIRYLQLEDIIKEQKYIEQLYHNVQQKAPVRIVKADIHYFIELKKHLKDNFIFRAFYIGEEMIAFTSGFLFQKHYEAHFIGIDYRYNKSHAIYQNILYDFVHEAIKSNATELVFGRTAMEIKSTVGAVAYPLFSYLRLSNSLLNKVVKPFIPSSENKNWIARNPYRENPVQDKSVVK